MANTKHFIISIQFLRQFAEIFSKEISAEMPFGFPSLDKLTATDFKEGETFEKIYNFIRKRMGVDHFHPVNLYKFVYRYLILKRHNHLGDNGFVDWEIKEKSRFPQALVHLLGYKKLDDFILDTNHTLIDDDTFEKQKALLEKFNELDDGNEYFKECYYCFIANVPGEPCKIGIVGITSANELRFRFIDDKEPLYYGTLKYDQIYADFSMHKNGAKNDSPSEVTIKVFIGDGLGKHTIYNGGFTAINNNDHQAINPAIAMGPIILKQIDPDILHSRTLSEIISATPPIIDPLLVAQISGKRIETKKILTKKSHKTEFGDREKEELILIDKENLEISSPSSCVGEYILLIPSKKKDPLKSRKKTGALRKLIFTIHDDLHITALAKRYHDKDDIPIQYIGNVISRNGNIIRFNTQKEFPGIDRLEGEFRYQSSHKPSYGCVSGIFRNGPKVGLAIFAKRTPQLEVLTSFDTPEIIQTDSEQYEKLDKALMISEYFAGSSISGYQLTSNIVMNDQRPLFKRLQHRKEGVYKDISGLYEEYYFDPSARTIYRDFIQVNKDGTVWMIGNNHYEGEVHREGMMFKVELNPCQNQNGFSVTYYINHDKTELNLYSGKRISIANNNSGTESLTVILLHLKDTYLEEKEFFQKSRKPLRIGSPEFNTFNEKHSDIATWLWKNYDLSNVPPIGSILAKIYELNQEKPDGVINIRRSK